VSYVDADWMIRVGRSPNAPEPEAAGAFSRRARKKSYLPPGAAPLLLFVPGPTFPSLDGFAALPFFIDVELCDLCFLALAAGIEPARPPMTRAATNILVVFISNISSAK
jgi:hypothetical protein